MSNFLLTLAGRSAGQPALPQARPQLMPIFIPPSPTVGVSVVHLSASLAAAPVVTVPALPSPMAGAEQFRPRVPGSPAFPPTPLPAPRTVGPIPEAIEPTAAPTLDRIPAPRLALPLRTDEALGRPSVAMSSPGSTNTPTAPLVHLERPTIVPVVRTPTAATPPVSQPQLPANPPPRRELPATKPLPTAPTPFVRAPATVQPTTVQPAARQAPVVNTHQPPPARPATEQSTVMTPTARATPAPPAVSLPTAVPPNRAHQAPSTASLPTATLAPLDSSLSPTQPLPTHTPTARLRPEHPRPSQPTQGESAGSQPRHAVVQTQPAQAAPVLPTRVDLIRGEQVQPTPTPAVPMPRPRPDRGATAIEVRIGTIDLRLTPPPTPPARRLTQRAYGFDSFRRLRDYGGWE